MARKRVEDLKPGDLVDLQGDKFADPNNDNPALAYEYQIVETIRRETPNCVAVWFESFDCVGFPPDHIVTLG